MILWTYQIPNFMEIHRGISEIYPPVGRPLDFRAEASHMKGNQGNYIVNEPVLVHLEDATNRRVDLRAPAMDFHKNWDLVSP